MSAADEIRELLQSEHATTCLTINDACARRAFFARCEAAFEALWQENNFKRVSSAQLAAEPSICALGERLLALLPSIRFSNRKQARFLSANT